MDNKEVDLAFGNWPHLILETAPESLIPSAIQLITNYQNDLRIPRVLVVPAKTDIRKYADDRETLCGPGVVVVCIGSAELKSILKNINKK